MKAKRNLQQKMWSDNPSVNKQAMGINVSQQQPVAHSILISEIDVSSQNEVAPDILFTPSQQNMCFLILHDIFSFNFVIFIFERRGRDRGWPHRNLVPNAKPSSRNWWLHSVPVTQLERKKISDFKTKVWPFNILSFGPCLTLVHSG